MPRGWDDPASDPMQDMRDYIKNDAWRASVLRGHTFTITVHDNPRRYDWSCGCGGARGTSATTSAAVSGHYAHHDDVLREARENKA